MDQSNSADVLAPIDDPIDPDVLALLSDLGDDGFLAELAQLFLGELDERRDVIVAAASSGGDELASAAHGLKGSAANMGLTALSAACAALEHHGRGTATIAVDQTLADLDVQVERARRRLTDIVTDNPAS